MFSSVTEAALAGCAAGLIVAATPGAVSALLIDLGATRGLRPALSAGLGVATVDGAYAVVAAWCGAAVAAAVAPVDDALPFLAAAVLIAVAISGLRRLTRPERRAEAGAMARRPYATFVGLTIVNPTTIGVFTTVGAGLADAISWSALSRCAFAGGVFTASLGWHVLLAGGAALLGGIPPRGRLIVTAVCHLLVLALAARMVIGR